MTDRSSEERSREKTLRDEIAAAINGVSRENASNTPDFLLADFLGECLAAFERTSRAREKWYGKSLSIGCSEVGATQSVAALEDRQVAAPDEVAKDAARRLLAGVKAVIASGVPSEATPSKDNAPTAYEQAILDGVKRRSDEAAKASGNPPGTDTIMVDEEEKRISLKFAPEVQGTPISERQEMLEQVGNLQSLLRAYVPRGNVSVDTSITCAVNMLRKWAKLPPLEVGTPQKEIPPMSQDKPRCQHYYGPGRLCLAYESEHFGQYGRADHTFEAAPVPEGVQGKEPQTFDEFWASVTPTITGVHSVDVPKVARKSWAAGRRSAITEMKQSAQSLIAARTAWLEQHGVPISREFANFAEAIGDLTDLIAECAELEEKTRP